MASRDEEIFRKVLEGIRSGAGKPKEGRATPAEIKKAKQLMKRDMKRRFSDSDVIDTGMFD